jgi:hypothetical protein
MSADDWMPCPFCSRQHNESIASLKARLKEEYERMPAKEYDAFKQEIRKKISIIDKVRDEQCTLQIRYDYGFTDGGEFDVYMGAYCPHCKRTWEIDKSIEPIFKNGGR